MSYKKIDNSAKFRKQYMTIMRNKQRQKSLKRTKQKF